MALKKTDLDLTTGELEYLTSIEAKIDEVLRRDYVEGERVEVCLGRLVIGRRLEVAIEERYQDFLVVCFSGADDRSYVRIK